MSAPLRVRSGFQPDFLLCQKLRLYGKCLQLFTDVDALFEFCGDRFPDWNEYQILPRCILEQTVKEKGSRRLATYQDGTMNSSILQNPSNPEATFRTKAGKEHRGYVANLEESVGENGSVITDYRFEPNTYSDSQFLSDTLTAMEPSEEPVTIATDGAYPTPGNQKLAETKNVPIISTDLLGKKANDFYAGFELATNAIQFIYMKKKVRFNINGKALVTGLFSTAIMSVCVILLMQLNLPNTITLIVEVICGAIVYILVNLVMKNALMFEIIEKVRSKILYKA